MNWKEFFKISIGKIILTIILLLVAYIASWKISSGTGLPLGFFNVYFGAPTSINFVFLIIDIIFWYVISCLIINLYHKK